MFNNKIIECEFEYIKCFSEYDEKEELIRFRDNKLKDMYYHNYTYIKKTLSDGELKEIIEQEIDFRKKEKSGFCNILLSPNMERNSIENLKLQYHVSINGCYSFDISKFSELKSVEDCRVSKVIDKEMIDHILYCDLKHDEERLGKDFCTRRCYRRGEIYFSDKGVNSYICYHKGEIVGNCDLFIHNGVAKIEDFAVIPMQQHKGYGTTILKHLIDVSIKEKCHTIYLYTDEDDTAKEMYEKSGFNKIGERIDLFFEL